MTNFEKIQSSKTLKEMKRRLFEIETAIRAAKEENSTFDYDEWLNAENDPKETIANAFVVMLDMLDRMAGDDQ